MVGGYPISGLDGGGYPPTRSGWWGRYPIRGLDGRGRPPSQVWMMGWGVPPSQVWMVGGTPHLGSGWWGVPWVPPPMRQSSIASTCYAAGGVPLAFTQEDFLVGNLFLLTM